MERVLGLDVQAANCTLAVVSQADKRLTDFPAETNCHALVEAIRRIPGRKCRCRLWHREPVLIYFILGFSREKS